MNHKSIHILARRVIVAPGLAIGLMLLAGCRPAAPITPSPTAITIPGVGITPAESSGPHVEISASSNSLKVGDEVTITGLAKGFGQEEYAISFSSGGQITTNYGNHTTIVRTDLLFEFVSVKGTSGSVEAVLRAAGGVRYRRAGWSGHMPPPVPGRSARPGLWSSQGAPAARMP